MSASLGLNITLTEPSSFGSQPVSENGKPAVWDYGAPPLLPVIGRELEL